MAQTLTKLVVNCETGQVEEIALTAEEIAEREVLAAEFEAERLAQEKAEAEREAAKAAAKSKLEALGLTPEEIAAITGA